MRYLMFSPKLKALSRTEVLAMAVAAQDAGRIKETINDDPMVAVLALERAGVAMFDRRLQGDSGPGCNPCGVPR